jgi:hypothetical protein
MTRQDHSPAYVLQIKRQWRVVILFVESSRPEYAQQSSLLVQALKPGFAVMGEGARLMHTDVVSLFIDNRFSTTATSAC